MDQDNLRELGKNMGQRLWGQAYFQRMENSGKKMNEGFWDLALAAWSLYDRPGLETKIRSLCVVAALTALGREGELRLHIFGALNNGATKEEIEETIVQVAPYGGLPVSRNALLVAKKVFSEYRAVTDQPI